MCSATVLPLHHRLGGYHQHANGRVSHRSLWIMWCSLRAFSLSVLGASSVGVAFAQTSNTPSGRFSEFAAGLPQHAILRTHVLGYGPRQGVKAWISQAGTGVTTATKPGHLVR